MFSVGATLLRAGRLELMDDIDRQLLQEIQLDADRSLRVLGEVVGLSAPAVQRRITRLKKAGVIDRIVAVLDRRKAGQGVTVLTLVTLANDSPTRSDDLIANLGSLPQVLQVHEVAGDRDMAIVSVASDLAEYGETVMPLLDNNPNVVRFETHAAVRTHKFTTALPSQPSPR